MCEGRHHARYVCPYCRAKCDLDDAVCGKCGAELKDSGSPVGDEPSKGDDPIYSDKVFAAVPITAGKVAALVVALACLAAYVLAEVFTTGTVGPDVVRLAAYLTFALLLILFAEALSDRTRSGAGDSVRIGKARARVLGTVGWFLLVGLAICFLTRKVKAWW